MSGLLVTEINYLILNIFRSKQHLVDLWQKNRRTQSVNPASIAKVSDSDF